MSSCSRDGDCCAALRLSLATIGSSYKHLIDEKDARIKQLGEQTSITALSFGIERHQTNIFVRICGVSLIRICNVCHLHLFDSKTTGFK